MMEKMIDTERLYVGKIILDEIDLLSKQRPFRTLVLKEVDSYGCALQYEDFLSKDKKIYSIKSSPFVGFNYVDVDSLILFNEYVHNEEKFLSMEEIEKLFKNKLCGKRSKVKDIKCVEENDDLSFAIDKISCLLERFSAEEVLESMEFLLKEKEKKLSIQRNRAIKK